MKRTFFILGISLLLGACTSMDEIPEEVGNGLEKVGAHVVPLENALKAGEQMYGKLYGNTRSDRKVSGVEYILGATRAEEGNEGFYVVNYGNEEGFCILSRDNRLPSVYAISDKGSLHLQDTLSNEGLNWYINRGLKGLSTASIGDPISPVVPTPTTRDDIETICPELLQGFTDSFHQLSPYNTYCLTMFGEEAMVGCVPLAIGTVMSYYKWPESYGSYRFSWSEMLSNRYSLRWARLFKEIGNPENCFAQYYPLDMGTTTLREGVQRTFDNMGYTNTQHDVFTIAKVNGEMSQRKPIIVEGTDYKGSNCHTWVIDGAFRKITQRDFPIYEGDDMKDITYYYRCVWGMGGDSNGYYLFDGNTIGDTKYDIIPNPDEKGPDVFSNLYMYYGMTKK